MAKKLPKTLQSWLIPKLRRISVQWPGKAIARKNAKRKALIGNFKNGKPKYKTLFECAECVRQKRKDPLHELEMTQMDHIKSVVKISGFTNWDNLLKSMFCKPEGYQCLCIEHHLQKTEKENELRRKIKRNKK